MKKRWRSPRDPTPAARQVWAALFPRQPGPAGWRVRWVGFMRRALGLTVDDERRILLSYGDHAGPVLNRWRVYADGRYEQVTATRPGPVDTLLHEFVNVRCGPDLRHGAEFLRLENDLRARLGLPPLDRYRQPREN